MVKREGSKLMISNCPQQSYTGALGRSSVSSCLSTYSWPFLRSGPSWRSYCLPNRPHTGFASLNLRGKPRDVGFYVHDLSRDDNDDDDDDDYDDDDNDDENENQNDNDEE